MKRIALTVGLALSIGLPASADPVFGLWQTEVDDGAYAHVKIDACGDKICGVFVRTFKAEGEYESENLGKMVVKNMVPKGTNHYRGTVWRPSNNKDYIGKIDLKGDTLFLKGCVAGGLFCAKQTWVRLKEEG